ncbi:MAG: hypothetical protein ACR2MG_21140 [Pyrinomonadaceae bacterium]
MTLEETVIIRRHHKFILGYRLEDVIHILRLSKLKENKMKIRIFRLLAAMVLMLTATFVSLAQSSPQDWSSVKNLTPGTNLIIETKNRETIRGNVNSATDSALNLSSGGNIITVNQNDISEIYLTKKSFRIKRAFIGAGIGAAVGFGIGGIYSLITRGDGLAAAAGLIYGLPIGAVVGAATNGKVRKGKLIYKSN